MVDRVIKGLKEYEGYGIRCDDPTGKTDYTLKTNRYGKQFGADIISRSSQCRRWQRNSYLRISGRRWRNFETAKTVYDSLIATTGNKGNRVTLNKGRFSRVRK